MKHTITVWLGACIMSLPAFAQKHLSNAAAVIAAEIAKTNRYESQFTGFAGIPSQQYIRYQQLRKTATEEELIALLRHKNAVVRVYSFKALYEADRKMAEIRSSGLLKDTATFMMLQGCIAGTDHVKNYVIRMLR